MDLNARVDVNCGWKENERTDGRRETGRLYHTLLKQVQQKMDFTV